MGVNKKEEIMKLAYQDLEVVALALQDFERGEYSIPVKATFTVIKNRTKAVELLKPYADMKNAIIKKYSNGTGQIKPEDENYAVASSELAECGSQMVEIDFEKLEYEQIKEAKIPVKIISVLYQAEIIKEEEDGNTTQDNS